MAEYEMQELSLPNGEGKRVLYPRMVIRQQASLEQIAERIQHASTYSKGEIIGLVQELARQIAAEMAEGKSVKIDGLGVFTPALGLRKDKERETGEEGEPRRNASSICMRTINFRADKQFIQEAAVRCTLERSKRKFRRSAKDLTPEQRLKLAQDFLQKNPCMNVSEYTRLTGLLRDAAAKELRKWAAQPDTGITTSGRSTHKVYIRRKES